MNQNEEQVAVENEAETTVQTESPQVETPPTEEQTVQDQADQPKTEQVPDVETEKPNDPREFQIKRLADENRRLKSERGSAFDVFKPQVTPQQGVDVGNYTDEYGVTNWNAYNAAVNNHIQQVASVQATQAVQEQLDEANARAKHPELFEDPDTEKQMAALWLWEKTQGNNVSVTEIAERFKSRSSKDVSKAEKKAVEKVLQEVTVKEQAGLAASGQTSQGSRQVQSDEEFAELQVETRVGNQDAIVARLRNIPWANK